MTQPIIPTPVTTENGAPRNPRRGRPPSAFTAAVKKIAKQLGVSPHTIRSDIDKGMPVAENGEHDLATCRVWKYQQNLKRDHGAAALEPAPSRATRSFGDDDTEPTSMDDSLARFRAARADEAEIRVKRMKARMVDYDVACEAIARRFGVVKRQILAVPETLADSLTVEQRTLLRLELDRALLALATPAEQVADEALSE